jgi:hypothetical protein
MLYKDSKNWVIIHDLRIEYGGLVAQIDHLLINRFLDFYVLETKHYSQGVKVTERGEFLAVSRRAQLFVKYRRLFKNRQTIDSQGFSCTKLSSISSSPPTYIEIAMLQ